MIWFWSVKEQLDAGAVDLIRIGWKSHRHVAEAESQSSCDIAVSGNQAMLSRAQVQLGKLSGPSRRLVFVDVQVYEGSNTNARLDRIENPDTGP